VPFYFHLLWFSLCFFSEGDVTDRSSSRIRTPKRKVSIDGEVDTSLQEYEFFSLTFEFNSGVILAVPPMEIWMRLARSMRGVSAGMFHHQIGLNSTIS
jgi:hypothetical protein